MKKLSLNLDALQVQSFATGAGQDTAFGTVHGAQEEKKKTGLQDTNCSAIDACASARGCTTLETCFGCEETNTCESYNDACPTGRGCSVVAPC